MSYHPIGEQCIPSRGRSPEFGYGISSKDGERRWWLLRFGWRFRFDFMPWIKNGLIWKPENVAMLPSNLHQATPRLRDVALVDVDASAPTV